jgi:hypothetical protein
MHKSYFSVVLIVVTSCYINAQDLGIRNYNNEYQFLDRLEILSGSLNDKICLTQKNSSTSFAVNVAESYSDSSLSHIDVFLKQQFLINNNEWASKPHEIKGSRFPVLKSIYKTPTNFFAVGKDDYYFAINPVINAHYYREQNNNNFLFLNTRGFELKGHIKKRLTFYTWLTDNQERTPNAIQDFTTIMGQAPGAGYWKNNSTKGNLYTDYSLAKGYLTLNGLNNHLSASFGHDRFFIGDGYRSLFLGDHGNNMLYAKLATRFWKVNYQNLWMELNPTVLSTQTDGLRPRKYVAMHHLSMNITKWLNVGAFEAIILGRDNRIDLQYLNPVIFYRTIEQHNGSPDNALLGFNAKALPIKNIQLYGQFLLDEFKFSELKARSGWWANKYAMQLGMKYINVAGIKNLDAQLEFNQIRPYTYTYRDSVRDYTNYNQALAHPNGTNLREQIAIIRYRPLPRLDISLEAILRKQGRDTNVLKATGGNIFENHNNREKEYGVKQFEGALVNTTYLNANASYLVMNNLYLDAGVVYRKDVGAVATLAPAAASVYAGLRLNAVRRKYNF